jgi:hypothetical protein
MEVAELAGPAVEVSLIASLEATYSVVVWRNSACCEMRVGSLVMFLLFLLS